MRRLCGGRGSSRPPQCLRVRGRPPPPLSFQLNRGIRVDLPALSFRAQSRNLTIKPGRFPFVRRLRSEISPRARLSASLGRNDKRGKRGWSTCSPCHFVMRRGIRVDLPAPSFRAQSRNLTIKPGRFPFVRRCRSEISPRARLTASLGRNDKRDAGAIYCSIKQILLFNIDYFISINNIYT